MAWHFTCRHTYEPTLCAELQRLGLGDAAKQTVAPGLVKADILQEALPDNVKYWDPIYALQVLPQTQLIHGTSVKQIALAAIAAVEPQLSDITQSWALHVLVPGQFKGMPKPPMARRAELIAQAIADELKSRRRRLFKLINPDQPEFLLQIVLLEAEDALVSFSPVLRFPPAMTWPSTIPAGLASVADDLAAPASSFRKLKEAIHCMAISPNPFDFTVDLGASPGGWTHVLRTHGAHVTAVDRADLSPTLMRDDAVTLVSGDAFAYAPAAQAAWLVSDIIAFPERVPELLQRWCGNRWMRHFVVQMKFKGEPDWLQLQLALSMAKDHGYFARAKHFFNDKNEVTIMGTLLPTVS